MWIGLVIVLAAAVGQRVPALPALARGRASGDARPVREGHHGGFLPCRPSPGAGDRGRRTGGAGRDIPRRRGNRVRATGAR